ncbi:hypothetical protein F7725_025758 [Dissostichus mawsoni]|uniref:Uncharacterized protein n=1 Tax=Dissostichus mawsoni TaxID=36200 RepID=A0A7J5X5J8_DISMA|nr:hypothetical protein F7725_025758 [Dissostichus mawsoni]
MKTGIREKQRAYEPSERNLINVTSCRDSRPAHFTGGRKYWRKHGERTDNQQINTFLLRDFFIMSLSLHHLFIMSLSLHHLFIMSLSLLHVFIMIFIVSLSLHRETESSS